MVSISRSSAGWVVWGGMLLALGYLPSLRTNFDFIDDGNLVYPAQAGLSASDYAGRWWDCVRANVEHLGPFRPVLWAHWHTAAELCDGNPMLWRLLRMAWCGLAAALLLRLMHELKITPAAALTAGAAAMWNPYRNEIWTSLTLAEGVAMPYAMLALLAARRAATSNSRAVVWDAAAILSLLACLGCKNTFAALLPAMLWLRLTKDGVPLWENIRTAGWSLIGYLIPLALPLGHFVYFRMNWQPGHYETPGPSLDQVARIGSWLKGAAGLDYLGVGMALCLPAALPGLWTKLRESRALVGAALALFAGGVGVYSVTAIMAARYTMPAVWGIDLLFAAVLSVVWSRPRGILVRLALAAVLAGTAIHFVANVGRQEKLAARSRVLWDVLHHVEATAPRGAALDWKSGEVSAGNFDAEEGIHFAWHLQHRGRDDLRIRLVDPQANPLKRVELPEVTGPSLYALRMSNKPDSAGTEFAAGYRFGRKQFRAVLETTRPTAELDPTLFDLMKKRFEPTDAGLLEALRPQPEDTLRRTAGR